MNPAEIMAEIAVELGRLPRIRKAFPHPTNKLGGFPAAVVGYPGPINYGVLSDDGHRLTIPAWIVIGGVVERETAVKAGQYLGDEQPWSVLHALNTKSDWETCDVVTVVNADTDVITIAEGDYLTAVFELDIAVTS